MNRQLPTNPALPKPLDSIPNDVPMSPGFRAFLQDKIVHYQMLLNRELKKILTGIHDQINNAVQGIGADITSAGEITPDHAIHRVTGTATIETINAPQGFSGPLFLIAVDSFRLRAANNIASDYVATPGMMAILLYDPIRQQWHLQG